MSKEAISLTLAAENLLWLRGRARATGRRSVSDFLDRLVSEVRTGGKALGGAVRSVVGTVRIDESDPDLREADAAVRTLFTASLGRPTIRRANPLRARLRRGLASRRRRRG